MSAPTRKGKTDFKKEVIVSAIRKEPQKHGERLEGEKEFNKSVRIEAGVIRQTRTVSNMLADKDKAKRVKTTKMNINRIDTAKSIRSRNIKPATTTSTTSAARNSRSRKQVTPKRKGTKFRASTMISNFIGKKQEERLANEELGRKAGNTELFVSRSNRSGDASSLSGVASNIDYCTNV